MEKEINFIEAVILISKSKRLYLCDNEDELTGKHPSICVYDLEKDFVGKLRWTRDGKPASVDEEVVRALKNEK